MLAFLSEFRVLAVFSLMTALLVYIFIQSVRPSSSSDCHSDDNDGYSDDPDLEVER